MSDSPFDNVYDPVATPNPAYDDDFEPTPRHQSSWDSRGLAKAMLDRARARQEAIADAFVDALLDGKLAFFRMLMDLEQASIAGEAEARQAGRPTLAEILLPMLERERAEAAAANQAAEDTPEETRDQAAERAPSRPMLVAPESDCAQQPRPGITDIHSAAERSCRTYVRKHPKRASRLPSKNSDKPMQGSLLLGTLYGASRPESRQRTAYDPATQIKSPYLPVRRRRNKNFHAVAASQKSYEPDLS